MHRIDAARTKDVFIQINEPGYPSAKSQIKHENNGNRKGRESKLQEKENRVQQEREVSVEEGRSDRKPRQALTVASPGVSPSRQVNGRAWRDTGSVAPDDRR